MEDTPLYNSRITSLYTSYVQAHYPHLKIEEILSAANMTLEQVQDPSHWFTHEQISKFQHQLQQKTGDPNIAYHVGKSGGLSESLGALKKYVLGFINPMRVFQTIEAIYPKLSRATIVRVQKRDRNRVIITAKPRPGIPEEPFQCLNRIGFFEAIAKPFTNDYADVSHKKCIHRGDETCEYLVTWKNLLSNRLRRILVVLIFFSILITVALHFILHIEQAALYTSGLAFINLIWALVTLKIKNIEYARTIQQQGDAANELIEEANERYNNALLIQEIGQAITVALDEGEIAQSFMQVMEKRLNYDRGFIMLLDAEQKRLAFIAYFGFSEDMIPVLQKASVRVERFPAHQILQQTLIEQKPFITANLANENLPYSEKFFKFVEKIKIRATIIVPIVYEKKSLGILAVDNVHSKRDFTQTDISLLMGIAAEIALSLANVFLLQQQIKGERRYSLLAEFMPIGLFSVDRDGCITNINPKMAEIVGAPQEQIIGRLIHDIKSFENSPLVKTFTTLISDGKPQHFQHTLTSVNSKSLELLCYIIPIRDSLGGVSEIQILVEDITGLNQMKAQLHHAQKMESMGTLAGGIAHDFNNILASITGFTELASKEFPENLRLQGLLSNILKASGRARDLVHQILLFSHKTEIDLKPLHIEDVLHDVLKLVRAFLPANIDIQTEIKPTRSVLSDVTQIHQIVMNLASNAAFAMRDKGGQLAIQLSDITLDQTLSEKNVSIDPGDYVRLVVSDTGSGIPADFLNRIFDPFFTTKDRGEGTGLGLAVVHGILRSQNGFITVASRVGEGTTFRLYWPSLARSGSDISASQHQLPHGTEHILFVDDEPLITEFAIEMLKSLDYKVTAKTDGQEAFDFFRSCQDSIDLLITDHRMPNLPGDKLASMVLKRKPNLPVIFMTGFDERMTSDAAHSPGIHPIIIKPFHLQDMAILIRQTLDKNIKVEK